MKEFYKKRFALTDGGARNLSKATLASFFVYCINMLPAILLMIFAQEVLENMGKSNGFYIVFSVLTLIAMYILLSIEYDKLYNTTYQESADLRIRTAENLSKLPLSYFSKHDISDISQTIMADIEGIEHAMSHSIPKVGGMVLFFPLISVMMLAGNVKMGLAVIIPSILSFIFIPLSKKYQVNGQNRYYDVLRKNSESFQENIEMQMEIKAYNLSKDIKDDLYKKMEDSERVHLKAEVTTILTLSISSIFSFISLAVVIFVGVNLIINKEINSLYLIGYLLAAMKIKDSLDASKEGLIPILFLIYPTVLAIVAGTVVMLFMAKVQKPWALFIFGMISPLVMFAAGHTYVVVVLSLIVMIIAELIRKIGNYNSFKYNMLSYAIFSTWICSSLMQMLLAKEKYMEWSLMTMGKDYVDVLEKLITYPYMALVALGAFLGGILGAYIGKALLKKHFEKAGIV